jgi:2-oxoisovalerate dehydrogenase E1 component alpha subunit
MAYWEARSPIGRFGRYLENLGWWDQETESELRKEARAHAIKALNDAETVPNPHVKHLFTDVFDEPHPILEEQQAELRAHIAKYREHYPDFTDEQLSTL